MNKKSRFQKSSLNPLLVLYTISIKEEQTRIDIHKCLSKFRGLTIESLEKSLIRFQNEGLIRVNNPNDKPINRKYSLVELTDKIDLKYKLSEYIRKGKEYYNLIKNYYTITDSDINFDGIINRDLGVLFLSAKDNLTNKDVFKFLSDFNIEGKNSISTALSKLKTKEKLCTSVPSKIDKNHFSYLLVNKNDDNIIDIIAKYEKIHYILISYFEYQEKRFELSNLEADIQPKETTDSSTENNTKAVENEPVEVKTEEQVPELMGEESEPELMGEESKSVSMSIYQELIDMGVIDKDIKNVKDKYDNLATSDKNKFEVLIKKQDTNEVKCYLNVMQKSLRTPLLEYFNLDDSEKQGLKDILNK